MEHNVRVAEPRETPRPLSPREQQFVAISVALTGFDRFELTGTGLTAEYLATVERWCGPEITSQLLAFGTAPPPDEQTVRARILSDPKLGQLARNLISLWYNGLWVPLPSQWYLDYAAEIPNPPDVTNTSVYVVSAQAYVEGLVWAAAHTHPMGAKQPGYGTWALPPKGGR